MSWRRCRLRPATAAGRPRSAPPRAARTAPRRRRRAPGRWPAAAARPWWRTRRAAARTRLAGARPDPRRARQSSGHRRPTARWRRRPPVTASSARASASAMPSMPRPRYTSRKAAISSARPARRTAKASSPSRVSGCFSSAITAAGAKSSAAAEMTRSRNVPGGVLANGRPAESSTRMPHVSRRTATRRASSRSGETSAAVRPGVSAASRRMSATVSASSCADGASMRLTPASARAHGLRIGRGDVLLPAARHARRAHGLGDEPIARLAGRAEVGAAQLLHVGALDAEGGEQLGEAELRMLGMLGDRRPAFGVEMQIEARQHDGALRQPRHGGHQLHRRRHRAGDAGDDHRAGRRRVAEALGFGEDGLVAPRGRRQQLLLGEIRRPEGGDDLEEFERALPVLGVFVRHQRGEAVERHVLGLDHVHQAGELGGEMRRLRRRVGARRRGVLAEVGGIAGIAADGLRPALHQHGQHQAALDLAHRRRQVERVGAERAGAGEAGQQRQILIARRDRPDLRQRHRAPAGSGEEGILHGARRTPRRQQQGDVGKLERARRTAARCRQVAAQDRRGDRLRETAAPPVP